MKEIRQIVSAFQQIDFAKNKAALATVARVEGSSYRRTGARMLVLDNGTHLGGISGGCLEGDALRRAQKAIATGRPSLVTYDTSQGDHHQIGVGLGCDGIIDVLFSPLDPLDPGNAVALLRARTHAREPLLLATLTDAPEGFLGKICPLETDGQWRREFSMPDLTEKVLADARRCLAARETKNFGYENPPGGGDIQICLEVLVPATRLVLFGAGSDVGPMARLASELGWDVHIVANPLKINHLLFDLAEKIHDPRHAERPEPDAFTAVVLMAHDYKTDLRNLTEVLRSPAPPPYIGLLGPRKRAEKMFDALDTDGTPIAPADMARIFAPAGLDIGASGPEEIALSIAAEIRACLAGRPGGSLRLRKGGIHEG